MLHDAMRAPGLVLVLILGLGTGVRVGLADPGDPVITVWSGLDQDFGVQGTPQRWVNVLGNVTDPDGIVGFTYSLNGGPEITLGPRYNTVGELSLGPDGRRLSQLGDFNIELDRNDLLEGPNQLVLNATDANFNTNAVSVTVNYTDANYWPENYSIAWAGVTDLQDAVQIVDGQWTLNSNGVRPVTMAYDRVLAIGDMAWDDYEIAATFTLHAIDPGGFVPLSGSPGFGMTARWTGHVPGPADPDAQPRYYWWPAGAGLWYDAGHDGPVGLGTWAGNLDEVDTSGLQITYDVPYRFKLRVETLLGLGTWYQAKVWPAGDAEPVDWLVSGVETVFDEPYGACVIVAHHVDITIGDLEVVELPDPNPPLIDNIQVTPTDTEATISWTTNEPATSRVDYGPTAAYENGAMQSSALVRNHAVVLPSLTTGQTYHFRISSVDVDSNGANSTDLVFVAAADNGPPVISNVQAAPRDKQATITWMTDELATSRVEYWSDGVSTNSVSETAFVTQHGLLLTNLTPDTLYHYRVGGKDVSGNDVTTNSFAFTTLVNTLEADTFDDCTLDTERWTFVDPLGDASFSLNGNQVEIALPASGVIHDVWTNGNFVPRLSQALADTDFVIETKFESALTTGFQSQGLLIEQAGAEVGVLRIEYHVFAGSTKLYIASIFGENVQLRAINTLALDPPMYLRVARTGNLWRVTYSLNGADWTTAAVFTKIMNVTHFSVYAGNDAATPHTAVVDYVINPDTPPAIEDDCNSNALADEAEVAAGSAADFNTNGVPDACECTADCNSNGVADFADLAAGTSADCNINGVPDECEADCNTNGIPDDCESFTDCQDDGIPDECQIAGNDCNTNAIPDDCEADCNTNGIPDDCEMLPDCNTNGAPDECEIAAGSAADCNTNGVPDDCEPDCNTNGIPDDCEALADCNTNAIPDVCEVLADCDTDGIPDECGLAAGTNTDCNTNGVPDACDITAGTSTDCNGNATPDGCEALDDCNTNGLQDICDIAGGTAVDCNGNLVPDACELAGMDCNANGVLDACDIAGATSTDQNTDDVPDDCQVRNLTRSTTHATIAGAFGLALSGDEILALPGHFAAEPVIDFNGKNLTLRSSAGIDQPTGGVFTLADDAGLVAAPGAAIDLHGQFLVGFLDSVDVVAAEFWLAPTGSISILASAGADIDAPDGAVLAGSTLVEANATLAFSGTVVNESTFTLQGGVLAAMQLNNAGSNGVFSGFGNISADVTNGNEANFIANTHVSGDYVNDGTTTIQSGTLTISGSLTNNGTVIGETAKNAAMEDAAATGLFVVGDYSGGAGGTLQLPIDGAALRVGGDFDVAIDDYTRFDMASAKLQAVGLGSMEQNVEVMSVDVGPVFFGLQRSASGHFPLGTLRVGPTPTTVFLRDLHDNDTQGQAVAEAVYVRDLVIDAGATLVTNGLRVYYLTLSNAGTVDGPANLIPIGAPPGDCDLDGDVDGDDYAGFASCLAGPDAAAPAGVDCDCLETFDFDGDSDVDLYDFASFQRIFNH